MKDILTAPFITEIASTAANMYRLGWCERNSGNISCLLEESAVTEYIDTSKVIRAIPIGFNAAPLAGKLFIVTATGSYFKNVAADPEKWLGIIRISADGAVAELIWGFRDGGRFTSELPAHLMGHIERLKADPQNRVITHCHPTHLMAMSFVHPLEEKSFTRTLWGMCTEGIMVFPDGVGVLPWMVCGTNDIGLATAEKLREYRIVVWSMHGIYGAGKSLDDAFGLIETVEKAAQIYMLTAQTPRINSITDNDLINLAKSIGANYRKDFFE